MNKFEHTPLVTIILFLVTLSACNTNNLNFSGEILTRQDSLNELRIQFSFELNKEAEAYVSFWTVSNPDKKYYSQLSSGNTSHEVTLVGLKGATIYNYQIWAFSDNGEVKSEIGEFVTEKFPINILHLRWEPEERTGLSGYILSQRRLVNGVIYLLDDEGDVVWFQSIPKQPKLSHWTNHNSILVLFGAAGHRNSSGDHIVEYDLYGNEIFHLNLGELDVPLEAHHEVRFDNNDHLVTLVYEHKTYDLSELGGITDQSVMGDKIIKMNTAGQVLWEWSIFDYLNPVLDSSILKTAEDWSHANSLSLDVDGNYLVSFRNFNQVWKIDAESGEVIWKLGEGGNIAMDPIGYFYGQHAFHVNADGDYMVFDNGRKDRQTRVLTFQFDEEHKTAVVKLNLPLSENLYSDKMGNAYLMDNNNILICAPRTNTLAVLNQKGALLAQARVGIPDPYRAEFVRELYTLDHVR